MSATATDIARVVEDALRRHALEIGNYQFSVVRDLLREEDHLWHVPIRPNHTVARRGAYYDVLNAIEEELEREKGLRVMLVPVRPDR